MSDVIARLTTSLAERYRVEHELGAGGIATVYLAHDIKHDRDVAIKVLHPDLGAALGGERFLTEIKTTAKLQHPHILPLLDSGAADGLLYYVMPYVRGETLRTRLTTERQLPVDDAVRIAREVADALEHAHKHGIIHRDIKPENILLQDGHALVADFGIALALQQAAGARMTQTGLSLGTPQYMSPEQATGERTIDARSDIYALGAVTYEMLAGEPPFTGPSVQAVVARLLADVPRAITTQRRAVPTNVEAAVMRALEKLPADRFATASAFASALIAPTAAGHDHHTSHLTRTTRSRASLLMATGAVVLATSAASWWIGQRTNSAAQAGNRMAVDVAVGMLNRVKMEIAISRDGKQLVAIASDSAGVRSIRLRDLAVDSIRTVVGTEGALAASFSPNGESLVFVSSGGAIRRIALAGGPSTLLIERGAFLLKGDWGDDGWVYFTVSAGGVARVRESGGVPPETLTTVDSTRHEFGHWNPQLLPGGKAVLFFSYTYPADSSRVEAFDFATRKRIPLVPNASNPHYVDGGYITFLRAGVLMAIRFDAKALRVEGNAVPVLTNVAADISGGSDGYAVSSDGTLAYWRQSDFNLPQLVREVGRDGRDVELLTPTGVWAEPRLSPDGRYLAFTAIEQVVPQIWLFDRARHVLSQLTRSAGASFSPNWTPDSKSLVHIAETPVYDIVRTPIDGGAVDTLLKSESDKFPTSVSADGRSFSYTLSMIGEQVFVRTGSDAARSIRTGKETRGTSAISPDGRWIAYREKPAGGRWQLFVQSLASPERRQVSADGGDQPRWTKNGRELVYRSGDAVLAATFDPTTGDPGQPVELFRRTTAGQLSNDNTIGYDVSPDGQHFFIIEPQQRDRRATVGLIFNWRGDLERALKR